jgi:translation initiation factor 2 alpha subunit (eIF-2alpha)
MAYEEGDIVIGTVDRLIGTSVFVKLDSEMEGVINFSEVAPGRIRNIRDYVNPGQRVVVKIMRIDLQNKRADLSLRRVNQKEKKEVLENERKEKELSTLLKIVTKNDSKTKIIFDKIKSKTIIIDFFENFLKKNEKENIDEFKSFGMDDKESKELFSMLKEKIKEKKINVKAEFTLHSEAEDGIERIRRVLTIKDADIKYLGAPHYMINVENKDYKEANKKMKEFLEEITKRAKVEGCILEIKEDK